ncbi:MAG: ferrochelatase [Pseudomonadota bacterium]
MRDENERIGIVLVNLGTPDAPESGALRRYLREFLSDPRVVEAPRWVWWLALNLVILRVRPAKSARNYRKIWTAQGSPLLVYTRNLTQKIHAQFAAQYGKNVVIKMAMRYGSPHLATVLSELHRQGVSRLLILPLFPQYSATTAGSIYDCVADQLRTWRNLPHLRIIGDYYQDERYIAALADTIRQRWAQGVPPRKLLFSFHGIPQRYADQGDPYPEQCRRTASAVAIQLGLNDGQWYMAFQSRFGRETWLQPYADKVLAAWAADGVESVSVVCPGFAVDCLETIEEIAEENAAVFKKGGGKTFDYIPALNDTAAHVEVLSQLVRNTIGDWLN